MTAKSNAGSAKTSLTRKKRSNSKTEQAAADSEAGTTATEAAGPADAAPLETPPVKTTRARTPRAGRPSAARDAAVDTPAATKAAAKAAAKPARARRKASVTAESAPDETVGVEPEQVATDSVGETPTAKRKPGRPRKTAKNTGGAADLATDSTPVTSPVAADASLPGETGATTSADAAEKTARKPASQSARQSARQSAPAKTGTRASATTRKSGKAAPDIASEAAESGMKRETGDEAAPSGPGKTTRKPDTAPARKRTARKAAEPSDAADMPAQDETTAAIPAKPAKRRGRKSQADSPLPARDETATADAPAMPDTVPTPVPVTGSENPSQERAAEDNASEAKPVFADLGLSEPIMRAIAEMGYEHPTPIQARAIPVVLERRDVLGVAQTGTGKTASFTLPMLERLAGSRARARMPRSLILEPTRELALQVAENLALYGKHLRLNHALLIGGESMADQRAVLNQGVDILIATPGRLMDLFDRGGLLLNQTGILVIDEADRMLDMGFIPDIQRIVSLLPSQRQTLLFSATMAPEIRTLADQFLHHPEEITVSRPSSVATTIEEALLVVDEHDKRRVLRKLLRRESVQNAIVFCNRKRDVDVLYKSLHKHGFAVGHLHGDLAQSLRFKTLERFKAGEIQILVCSDVAARGIDIGGLSHVFNFDLPFNAEDYIHRIGRTGRAGKTGHAFSLASPRQQLLAEGIEKLKHAPIPLAEIEGIETLPWADPEDRNASADRRPKARERDRDQDRDRDRRKDRGGRGNRRSDRSRETDRDHEAERAIERPEDAPAPTREERAPRHASRAAKPEPHSISPAAPFDHDTPRTGFGHDTPAFMLLPRRNRKAEHAEQDEHTGPIQHRGTV